MAFSSGQRLVVIILFLAFLSGGGVLGYRIMKEYPKITSQEIEKSIIEEPVSPRPLVTTEKIPIEQLSEKTKKKFEEALRININTASSEELQKIPFVGAKKAQYIIAARPYGRIEDITKAQGIGEKTFEKIKDYITVSGEGIKEYVKGDKVSFAPTSPEKPEAAKKVKIVKIDTDGDGVPDTWVTRPQ